MTDQEAQRLPIRAGDLIADRYRVERVLGKGGMGIVVAARHVDLDELRAIKLLRPSAETSPRVVTRFLREARATVKLKSEHIAQVYDVGRLDSGLPFTIMEYLEGQDLRQLLRKRGAVEPVLAVDLVMQALEALAEAHVMGIVHRDLKPPNLFLTYRKDGSPCLKLLDFGISKISAALAEESGMDMTQTTTLLGSPLYMAPEQMASSKYVDARADIWALGVVLYELLAGARPFAGPSITAVAIAVTGKEPAPIRSSKPEVPAGLEQVVMRCLVKQPDGRFGTVLELAEALAPFCSEESRPLLKRIGKIYQQSGGSQPLALDSASSEERDGAGPMALAGQASSSDEVARSAAAALSAGSSAGLEPGEASPQPIGGQTDVAWGHGAAEDRPRRRRRVGLIIGAGLGAGVLIAGAIVVVMGGLTEVGAPESVEAQAASAEPAMSFTASQGDGSSFAEPTPTPSVEATSSAVASATASASASATASASTSGTATSRSQQRPPPGARPARPAKSRPSKDAFGEGWR